MHAGCSSLDRRAGRARDVREVLALDDTLLTLKLTPNRADCLSIARHRARRRRDHRRAADAAATSPRRRSRSTTRAPCASRTPRRVPALRGRVIDGIDAERADAGVDGAAPRAQRAPLDLARRRHHQLRDARARPAAARVRRRAARRRDRRALRARRREADAAERPDARRSSPTCCWSATRRSRSASPASWAASTRASATTRRDVFLEGAFWNPAVIQGKMRAPRLHERRRLPLRARRRFRAAARARVERATAADRSRSAAARAGP